MRKIVVALSKGGVGKTTSAVNLAAGLAKAGRRVLLVDTDTQGQAAGVLGVAGAAGLADVLEEKAALHDVIQEARKGLYILPAGDGLAGAKRVIARREYGGEYVLREALEPLNGFDYILLDSAPSWDAMSINNLFFADEILAPASLEALTLMGLADFVKRVKMIQERYSQHKHNVRLAYLLPTFLDGRVKKSDEILEQLRQYFGPVLCEPIRYNVAVSEAAGRAKTIFEYAPKSAGAADYKKLTRKVLSDE